MVNRATVTIVEDDYEVARAMAWQLAELQVEVRVFSNPRDLLALSSSEPRGCLVVDLRLPQMSGLELLRRLRNAGWRSPFLVITGYGEVPDAVSAMREGAIDFIQKPFDPTVFLAAVRRAIEQDLARRDEEDRKADVLKRLERLTPRESEVLDLVVEGKLSKQIAFDLGVALKTVETHRSSVTRKLEVDSVAQLVRIVLEARR